MSDETFVDACPECGSSAIQQRQQRDHPQAEGRGYYLCSDCRATFDEPARREPIQGGSSFVSQLQRADPDDVLGGERA